MTTLNLLQGQTSSCDSSEQILLGRDDKRKNKNKTQLVFKHQPLRSVQKSAHVFYKYKIQGTPNPAGFHFTSDARNLSDTCKHKSANISQRNQA